MVLKVPIKLITLKDCNIKIEISQEDTIPRRFDIISKLRSNKPAYYTKHENSWRATTWSQYRNIVQQASKSMIELNLKPKDTICILGRNIPEWSIVNLAALMIGCVPVVNRIFVICNLSCRESTEQALEKKLHIFSIIQKQKYFSLSRKNSTTISHQNSRIVKHLRQL